MPVRDGNGLAKSIIALAKSIPCVDHRGAFLFYYMDRSLGNIRIPGAGIAGLSLALQLAENKIAYTVLKESTISVFIAYLKLANPSSCLILLDQSNALQLIGN